MDHMTPTDLAWIAIGVVIVITARVAWAARAIWMPVARGLWHRYVADFRVNLPVDDGADPGFANAGTDGSTAFGSDGTARTADDAPNAPFAPDALSDDDLRAVMDLLEQRGYVCLSPAEQEVARRLVYQTERRARLEPVAQRSKSDAIERGAGLQRGGGAAYRRASAIYDAVVGKPDPAVVAPGRAQAQQQEVPA